MLALALGNPRARGAEDPCPDSFAKIVEVELQPASKAEQSTAKVVDVISTLLEPFNMAGAAYHMNFDRIRARQLIQSNSAKATRYRAPDIDLHEPWATPKLYVSKVYGAPFNRDRVLITIRDLKFHFTKTLGEEVGQIASHTIDEFMDRPKIIAWAQSVRNEMNAMMTADGISAAVQTHPSVRELYLDKVLVKRAVARGFLATEEKLPFNIVTFNSKTFFQNTLGKGRVFVDWTGIGLSAPETNAGHYARGHLLAMAYGAENVPRFVDLMKTVGQTGDRDGLWSMLFDNVDSTQTPFWSGHWMRELGPALGVRY